MLLLTGASGFIGSSFLRLARAISQKCVVLDSLTYAGRLSNIESLIDNHSIFFIQGNINDSTLVSNLFQKYHFSSVVNFAAETHVDTSIDFPAQFAQTNFMGTLCLLEAARCHWTTLSIKQKNDFRFLQVSTDEVFGSLSNHKGQFTEKSPYLPNSPYSASKAGADHLVRAWHHTYGLPTITTYCSNNYGPRQHPEKLIPRMIRNCLLNKSLPIYGDGLHIRDWIHVEDHCNGIMLAIEKGVPGASYCFGGHSERSNIHVATTICKIMDELKPRADNESHEELITFVSDRPGHDHRYAIDDTLAQTALGFSLRNTSFEVGLKNTIKWYLNNPAWLEEAPPINSLDNKQ